MPVPSADPDPHVAAVEAVIGMLRGAGLTVFDGEPPSFPPALYVSVYADLGAPSRTTLAATSDRRDVRFQTTFVGQTPEQVRRLQSRARAVLLDQRPTVTGRMCWPLTITDSQVTRLDRDVTPPVAFAVDVYGLAHVPA